MSKPGSSYSSSRLDLTGENVTELTEKIATAQPVLGWLHSGDALELYNDPYIQAPLRDPVGAIAGIYSLRDEEGEPIGQQFLNVLYMEELGHQVTPEDFLFMGAQFFQWMQRKITGFRGLELVRYLSAADSAEKLIAGSIIKAAIEAQEKHGDKDTEDVDLNPESRDIQRQANLVKENQPEFYELVMAQLERAAAYQPDQGVGSDTPELTPIPVPVVGDIENRGEDEEQPQDSEGQRLSTWIKVRDRGQGFLERILGLGDYMRGRGL